MDSHRVVPPRSRIVLVDGSSASRRLLIGVLREQLEDVEVLDCGTGAEALAALAQGHVDLVSTSLMLPDMDGLDFAAQVRRLQGRRYTPLVLVSSQDDPDLLRKGLKAGVTDYFDKSRGYKAFGEFVRIFIRRHARLEGRLLYVEDSRTTAAVIRPLLEQQGLEVEHTASGEEALARLTETAGKLHEGPGFDLVVTDLTLKGRLSGEELLHALRARHHYSQQELPVLVLTGHEDLRKQVELFHLGANDFVNKPIVEAILLARVRSLLLVKHQYDMLKRQAEAMHLLATTDSLTRTYNKCYLLDHGEDFLRAARPGSAWVLLIDIDHFKRVNDEHGHLVGDRVLAAVGQTLTHALARGLVARFGGEEFCALLRDADRHQALAAAEALRSAAHGVSVDAVRITVSVGLAGTLDHPDGSFGELLALADKALYHAKAQGRDRVSLYDVDGPQGTAADGGASASSTP
ncbi:diguanylate cyclase [Ectothiorhodospiraceae bacterium 2226]|nr:diguanylate cyclase [Ectothiorhodospiraceae bacterium 2226]